MAGRTLAAARRAALAEGGFTIVELLVAVIILTGGVLALVSTFDSSRRLADSAEKRDASSAAGEREMERIKALPWGRVALAAAPADSADPANPASFVDGGNCGGPGLPASSPCYQWDWSDPSALEPLVIDAGAGDATPNPQSWSTPAPGGGTRITGQLYRFVTWVKDPSCTASTCGGANAYKRITVGVTATGMKSAVVLSTLVRDSAGGAKNPLTNPATTCTDGATQVPCAQ